MDKAELTTVPTVHAARCHMGRPSSESNWHRASVLCRRPRAFMLQLQSPLAGAIAQALAFVTLAVLRALQGPCNIFPS